MPSSEEGKRLLSERRAAEDALKHRDAQLYGDVEHWLDSELYGGLYGHGGADPLPAAHKREIMNLLRARAAVHRGRKTGAVAEDDDGRVYDSEVGNEQMAQTIDSCLEWLGQGPELPRPEKTWHDFLPEWM